MTRITRCNRYLNWFKSNKFQLVLVGHNQWDYGWSQLDRSTYILEMQSRCFWCTIRGVWGVTRHCSFQSTLQIAGYNFRLIPIVVTSLGFLLIWTLNRWSSLFRGCSHLTNSTFLRGSHFASCGSPTITLKKKLSSLPVECVVYHLQWRNITSDTRYTK